MTDWTFRISQWQMAVLVFLVSLCVTPFAYNATILLHLHRLAWAALVPAYGVGLLGTFVAIALLTRFPNEPIVAYAPRVLGPAAGRAFLFLLGLLLLSGAPANLHMLGAIVRFAELPRTTSYIPSFLFVGVVGFGCYFGPEVIARMGELTIWLIAAGLVVIFFAPLATAVPARLLPLGGVSWSAYATPAVSSSLGTVRGFLCVLVLGGMLRRSEGLARFTYGPLTAAWVLLLLSLALPIMILGNGFAEQMRYPILAVTGTVSFRWLPFQRLTTTTLLVWQMIMYVVLGFYLWSGAYVLAAACGIRNWRLVLLPAAAAAAILGGVSLSPLVAQRLTDIWNFAVIAIGIALPALLWMASIPHRSKAVQAQ